MQDPTSAGIFAWMMVPIAMVADAAVVAVFGNSLGKGLLGVRVRSMDGKALRFSAYMQRNFKVWTYDFGLCIPLISLLTMGSQAQALKKRTATGYDSGLYEVKALPLGPVRAIAAATVIVLLFALVAYLNVQEQADRRNFATGHDWTNPVTRAVVQVPPGWVSTLQTNDQGQSIYMFTYPRENLAVVFGNESLSRGMTGAAYAQAFPFAVKDAMALGAATEAGPVNGKESWTTTGYIVADSKQSVVVTIVQSGNQMWRTVAIRLNGMPPDTDSYRRLQDRLFASIR
jgi:hypothetical protein